MKPRARFTRSVLICLVLIGLALTVGSMSAGQIVFYDLVLTENSSTDLSLSYNGPSGASAFTVTNTSADHWTIAINSAEMNIGTFVYEWEEPESSNEVNKVTTNPFQIFVTSDLSLLLDGDAAPQNNNTRSAAPIGFDVSIDNQIFLTFNDLAEAGETAGSSVPDTGSTLAFLGLAAVLLLVAARIRSVHAG
jgi:hypothetical protein